MMWADGWLLLWRRRLAEGGLHLWRRRLTEGGLPLWRRRLGRWRRHLGAHRRRQRLDGGGTEFKHPFNGGLVLDHVKPLAYHCRLRGQRGNLGASCGRGATRGHSLALDATRPRVDAAAAAAVAARHGPSLWLLFAHWRAGHQQGIFGKP